MASVPKINPNTTLSSSQAHPDDQTQTSHRPPGTTGGGQTTDYNNDNMEKTLNLPGTQGDPRTTSDAPTSMFTHDERQTATTRPERGAYGDSGTRTGATGVRRTDDTSTGGGIGQGQKIPGLYDTGAHRDIGDTSGPDFTATDRQAQSTHPKQQMHGQSGLQTGTTGDGRLGSGTGGTEKEMENTLNLPGTHGSRAEQEALGQLGKDTSASGPTRGEHQTGITSSEHRTYGQTGSHGGETGGGRRSDKVETSQNMPGAYANRAGQDTLGEYGNNTSEPVSTIGERPARGGGFEGQAEDRAGKIHTGTQGTAASHTRAEPTKVGLGDKSKEHGHGMQAATGGRHGGNVPSSDKPMQAGGAGTREKDVPPAPGKTGPGLGDKLIGRTQKAMGILSDDPKMVEKGERRETLGKDTTTRAPKTHD